VLFRKSTHKEGKGRAKTRREGNYRGGKKVADASTKGEWERRGTGVTNSLGKKSQKVEKKTLRYWRERPMDGRAGDEPRNRGSEKGSPQV